MFCKSCGNPMNDTAKFCENCGAPVAAAPTSHSVSHTKAQTTEKPKRQRKPTAEKMMQKGTPVTENIYLCPDGVYRWYYEFPMLKNPTILFTVYKVLGLSFGIVYLLLLVMDGIQGNFDGWEGIWGLTKVFLILAAVFIVLGALGYLLVAAMYGGKYMVLFEMTDTYVKHTQLPKQFKKAQALGWLTAMAGLVGGRPSTIGAGILAATKNATTTEFNNVRTVKVSKRRRTIKVNQLLSKNQVYADGADFDFVRNYIVTRCGNAKVKG